MQRNTDDGSEWLFVMLYLHWFDLLRICRTSMVEIEPMKFETSITAVCVKGRRVWVLDETSPQLACVGSRPTPSVLPV